VRHPLSGILSLLYPAKCAACRRSGAWLCAECLQRCTPFGGARCAKCGSAGGSYDCSTCRVYIRNLDGLRAAFEYAGPVRPLVHAFKYRNMSGAAEWMAGQMIPTELTSAREDDVLVPVPMHPSRQRNRGYNQAAALCGAIRERTGLPMALALQRAHLREAQARLSAEQRWINVHGAFAPGASAIEGRVLLIDDVCTTGATLEECARVLKLMGAAQVTALVFARA